MNFFKTFFFIALLIGLAIGCTKNGVNSDISGTRIQLFNYYQSDKTYSLLQGSDTVISGVGFDQVSKVAEGAPGFYSLSVVDNSGKALLAGNTNLLAGTGYSLFIVQDSSSKADSARYTLVSDNAAQRLPLYDSCRVRFLDFARNIQYIDLRFVINQGVGFGQYSPFFAVRGSVGYLPTHGRYYLDNNNTPSLSQYFTIPSAPTINYVVKFLNGNDTTQSILPSAVITFNKQKKYTMLFLGRYDSTGKETEDPFRYELIEE